MALSILTVVEDAPEPLRPERQRTPYGVGVDADSYIEAVVKQVEGGGADVDGAAPGALQDGGRRTGR